MKNTYQTLFKFFFALQRIKEEKSFFHFLPLFLKQAIAITRFFVRI